ncbi:MULTISPECIES: hypothetical protein [Sorangium]|uniref:Uncharacterized protein n=1 Tax=Sorangium cellulosum TaxID=56 RepID=A0A4V0NHQ9_SORCE|nr:MULTISPECIES: hypothetical protein [Sorangium]AUX37532.1 uncharacterized protein SOCE836_097570 [Sorangium cellulosum]WCQ96821.1 hypothetical protein NQZ70_09608 [Sorangium sp. Soce836]
MTCSAEHASCDGHAACDLPSSSATLDRLRAIAEEQSTAAASVPAFYVRGVLDWLAT